MTITIDSARLLAEIEALALISEAEPPVVTRVVFTSADMRARSWFIERCKDAGLSVRRDAIGNTFARWEGSDPQAAVVGTGSHIDAIPNAGKYDGVVGVLGGLEAIRALKRARFQPANSIELLLLTSEEPTRFGIGCLGSRLLAGVLSSDGARKFTDENGEALEDVRRKVGLTGELESVKLPADYYKAFVELHIEQGPLLERKQMPLGIVTKIAAPASARVTIEGSGGHAGGVLMPQRRDALCAAAEMILLIETAARTSGSADTVATVGMCDVFPGAVNSIPSRVEMDVDIRDTDEQRRNRVLREIEQACVQVAARRKLQVRVTPINADAPASCSPRVIDALVESAEENGLPYKKMVSRAYHDSLFMARIAPVGMVFIPCRGGVSHRPDEYSAPQEIETGARVLASTLARLSQV